MSAFLTPGIYEPEWPCCFYQQCLPFTHLSSELDDTEASKCLVSVLQVSLRQIKIDIHSNLYSYRRRKLGTILLLLQEQGHHCTGEGVGK